MTTNLYTDISTTNFPKTLMIRNHEGGLIWQIYHVDNQEQVNILIRNSYANGFLGSTLENHQPEREETWTNWREVCSEDLKATLNSK